MPTSKPELKARLVAQAEAAIDELLAQKPAPETATLGELEHIILKAGQTFQQALTSELLTNSGETLTATWPMCPTCGQRMKAKGKRKRRVATLTGEAEVERDYYHCGHCRKGLFPLG